VLILWLLAATPQGFLPVLETNEGKISQTTAINTYIAEKFGKLKLNSVILSFCKPLLYIILLISRHGLQALTSVNKPRVSVKLWLNNSLCSFSFTTLYRYNI